MNLIILDLRSRYEQLINRILPRCPYCGQRDRQPETHLARVHVLRMRQR